MGGCEEIWLEQVMWYKVSSKTEASIGETRSLDIHLELFNHTCIPTSCAPDYGSEENC